MATGVEDDALAELAAEQLPRGRETAEVVSRHGVLTGEDR